MDNSIRSPLNLPDVRVLELLKTARGDWLIKIESTFQGTTCHQCGREITDLHLHLPCHFGADDPLVKFAPSYLTQNEFTGILWAAGSTFVNNELSLINDEINVNKKELQRLRTI